MTTEMKRNRTPLSRRPWLLFALVALCTALSAAAGPGVPRAQSTDTAREMQFPRSRLTIETATGRFDVAVEVADTWERRARGLQHRRTLAPDAGMLFDYKESRPVAMWMKNTRIPLDMLFIDAAGRVARLARDTEPFSLTPIPSGQPVRAVLELNAGTARRLGIGPGDRVRHPIFDAAAN